MNNDTISRKAVIDAVHTDGTEMRYTAVRNVEKNMC